MPTVLTSFLHKDSVSFVMIFSPSFVLSDIESASNNFETVVVEVVCPQACSLYSGIGEIKNARITVVKCMVLNGFLIFCWIVPYNTLTQVMCFLLCH